MFYRLHWIALSLGAAIALDGSTAIAMPSSSLSKQLESSMQDSSRNSLLAPDTPLLAKKGTLLDSQRSEEQSEANGLDDPQGQDVAQADPSSDALDESATDSFTAAEASTETDTTAETDTSAEAPTETDTTADTVTSSGTDSATTDTNIDTSVETADRDEPSDVSSSDAEGAAEAEAEVISQNESDESSTDDSVQSDPSEGSTDTDDDTVSDDGAVSDDNTVDTVDTADEQLVIPDVDVEAIDEADRIDIDDLVPAVDDAADDVELERQPLVDTVNPPDYLNADPNPLRFPTRPEEVEIIGTQPITLEEAYAIALRNNRDLQVAQFEFEQAEAALREAQAANSPTVQAESGLSASENTESSLFPGANTDDINLDLSGTVSVSYDLFTSGRRSSQIEAVEGQVELSKLEVERISEDVRFDVADRYYDLQLSDEQVRISAAFLEEAIESRRDAEIRERAGVGTRFDVLQAQVQVANAQQDLTQARSNQIVARRALAEILSVPPSITLQATAVEVAEDWPLSLEESIVLAFQSRAELQQFLLQREVAQEQRDVALSALGPQVNLFASYNVSDRLSDESSGLRDQYTFGAQLNWLFFDGGAARARAAQQDSNIEIAETQFADTLELIRLQVEQSFYDQEANFANIGTAEVAVNQAREALRLARLRFQAGVGTQLEVINAQADLTRAESNLVQAQIGFNRAIASLRRSISNLPETRLIESLEIPPDSEFVFPLEVSD